MQAMRLTMVQVLMNSKGLAMNPIQSLYYVSPACLVCLLVPFSEWRDGWWPGALMAGAPSISPVGWARACACMLRALGLKLSLPGQ